MNNHHDDKKDSLRNAVLSKIQSDHIAMRPRIYFTLKLAAVAGVAFLSLALSIFIFNFILFSIRINSHDAFLAFGPRGIQGFLMFFPWITLMLDVALIVLLERLVRTFRFGYRIPIVYIAAGIIALTCVAGFAIDRGTYFNDRLMDRANHEGLPPPLAGLYHGAMRPPHDGICRCTVTAIEGSTLTVADFRGGATSTYTVLLPNDSRHATSSGLTIGDIVFVAGDRDESGVIHAFGVRKEGARGFRGRPPQAVPAQQ